MAHDPRTFGLKRRPKWRKVRARHLKKFPKCAVCKGKTRLTVHHCKPLHYFPELELDPTNLITLCEYRRCHIGFGHLNNFKSYNPDIRADAYYFNQKIVNRP